jgi:hypothetical protein
MINRMKDVGNFGDAKRQPTETAGRLVVVLILVHTAEPNPYEEISLRQCFQVLGAHPIYLVCPRTLNVSKYRRIIPGINVDYIDPDWQITYASFNRLKIEPFLYKRYHDYQFILFYELDAFVFRDELIHWCDRGFDYIGAPWFDLPWMKNIEGLTGYTDGTLRYERAAVGNGGLSLRRVDAVLKVLRSFSWVYRPTEIWSSADGVSFVRRLAKLIKSLTLTNNSFHLLNTFRANEDLFWGIYMKRNFGWFEVAPVKEALKFSQHGAPSACLKRGGPLPFGCHGWWKENGSFWIPLVQRAARSLDIELGAMTRFTR